MRRLRVVTAVLLSTMLTGCYVQSVHPLYTESTLIHDPGLEGTWVEADEPGVLTLTANEAVAGYMVTLTDSSGSLEYEGHLVQLGEATFLDIAPLRAGEPNSGDDFLPLHQVFRVQRHDDELRVSGIDYKWLDGATIGDEPDLSCFRYDGRIVLAMETKDLQGFIVSLLDREGSLEEPTAFHRKE